MAEEKRNQAAVGALVALFVAALLELGVALGQLLRGKGDLDQPVTMRTFLLVLLIQVGVFGYLLLKVLLWGTPAVLG